jgi:hypothetical protein
MIRKNYEGPRCSGGAQRELGGDLPKVGQHDSTTGCLGVQVIILNNVGSTHSSHHGTATLRRQASAMEVKKRIGPQW